MGRFMTPDWSEKPATVPYADLSDPQTLNIYSYVRNSPVARFDADGHFVTSAGSAAAPACNDGTSSCMPNQNCSADVTTNCVNSSTTTVTAHGAGNNNDEAVIDGTRRTVWTDSNGNQHTTVSTAEILVGGEGNWKAGVIDARGGSTTYDSSGKMESSSSFGRVDGAYYSATPQQLAAAVGVLGGMQAINQAMIMVNPDWVHHFGNNVASDVHDHPWRTFGRAAQLVVYGAALADPPTSAFGLAGLYATFAGTVADIGNQAYPDKP